MLAGGGKHEFEPVFLIDFRRAGVVVDGDDICPGIFLLHRLHHALADDMIRQAAERLHDDDVRDTAVDQFRHFRREEPALAHFCSVSDVRFGAAARLFKACRCTEDAVFFHGADHVVLFFDEIFAPDAGDRRRKGTCPIQLVIRFHIEKDV